jgi:uncharacterized protein (TIGR01244 family)
MQSRSITDRITIAGQPSEAELGELLGDGYVGVVNLRNDGEPEQPLGTSAEGEIVRKLGLDYLHEGVGGRPLMPETVRAVCGFLDTHSDGKVLVHCRKGSRAAALVLIREALAAGWKPDEAIARGAAMGLQVEGGLRMIVEQYLAEHAPKS